MFRHVQTCSDMLRLVFGLKKTLWNFFKYVLDFLNIFWILKNRADLKRWGNLAQAD
jgi:hypothetical protein